MFGMCQNNYEICYKWYLDHPQPAAPDCPYHRLLPAIAQWRHAHLYQIGAQAYRNRAAVVQTYGMGGVAAH